MKHVVGVAEDIRGSCRGVYFPSFLFYFLKFLPLLFPPTWRYAPRPFLILAL
jgi:hypothetical protein